MAFGIFEEVGSSRCVACCCFFVGVGVGADLFLLVLLYCWGNGVPFL